MTCAEPVCHRAAEVAIHCDAGLVVVACFSCGVRLGRGLRGRMELLDGTKRRLDVTSNDMRSRNDCVR